MKPMKGGARNGDPLGVLPAEAANEPVIEGAGQPAGWDPFEVWRTRVRDVRHDKSRAPEPANKD